MKERNDEVMFEGALEAAPEKVWRALTIPEYLTAWLLPASNDNDGDMRLDGAAAGLNPISCTVIEARAPDLLRYRWREDGQPDAIVTFELRRISPDRTWLRLSQGAETLLMAAKCNAGALLAA
jgi:uncharacterized protein YndB with AHSA1/START domain